MSTIKFKVGNLIYLPESPDKVLKVLDVEPDGLNYIVMDTWSGENTKQCAPVDAIDQTFVLVGAT